MDERLGIIFCFLLFFSCCRDPVRKDNQTLDKIFLTDLGTGLMKEDSLITIFHRMDFIKTLDTFQISSELPLERMSLIEYYSINTYSISNKNCLILEYSDKAYVTLFKYDFSSRHWIYSKGFEFPVNRIRNKREGIQNSPLWNEKEVTGYNDSIGDVAAFTSIGVKKEGQYFSTIVSNVRSNPNSKLYEMFVELIAKED